ncbi:hypothetical protein Ccrd_010156 [Cynara cardunculus var. scolymus]|uniref:E3 ubiquitin-protein ligase APD1-4 middle domain-containing protein n=1 Tax=Cynara cardunculus var. scolymus TaxID=59895 RepID=A0A103YLQ6_CYNCS|nr:hypothetical protein Ccrd_010156 [Cynara cardunculus var. scolymus]
MEDSNQTPLLHQSLNAAATHGVQPTGLPSTVAEYGGIDGIPAKPTIYDCYVDVPASFYPSAGNDSVEEPNIHHLVNQYCDDSVIDDDLTVVDDETVVDDDLAAADDDLNQIFGEQSTWPPLLSHPDRSRLYNLPPRPRNPNELCLWNGVQIITCIILLAILWLIVCLNMVYGVQEIGTLRIGTGCSLLLKPNRFFVKTITVEQLSANNVGAILYGFNNQPPLNVVNSWSDARNASLQANIHKARTDGYGPWLYDQSSPNTTLSWNIVRGNGLIQQNILQSGRYHIAVGNLNSEVVEVQLNMSARAFIYDTSDAYYKCTFAQGPCVTSLLFLEENHAVLTTPQLKQAIAINGMMLLASVHFWVKYGHMVTSSGAAICMYYSENTRGLWWV